MTISEQTRIIPEDIRIASHNNPPEFDGQVLENFDDFIEYRVFLRDSVEAEASVGTINLDELFGTTQAMYAGDSIGYLLRNRLKRVGDFLEESQSTPEYFYGMSKKQNIGFIAIGNKLFVEEGKHRAICFKYLVHYYQHAFGNNSIFSQGPVISGVEVKQLVQIADFSEAMNEFQTLLDANPQLHMRFDNKIDGINVGMPTLRNWERDLNYTFRSAQEFTECMTALKNTTWIKRQLGQGFHRFF